MASNDYFEEKEEPKPKRFVFELDGKTYVSIEQMREEATDTQLKTLQLAFDSQILKTEKQYKIANIKFSIFAGMTLLSVGSFIASFFLPEIPNIILKSASIFGFSFGTWGIKENVKKYTPVEDYLTSLYYVSDSIEEEILMREYKKLDEEEKSRAQKEIFPEIFGQLEEKEVS